MGHLDFEQLAQCLLAQSKTILTEWFPSGKIIGKEFCIGDLEGSPGKSLRINIETGKWSDFATGHTGGDLISVWAGHRGIGNGDAYKELNPKYGNGTYSAPTISNKTPQAARNPYDITQPPKGTKKPSCKHPKFGNPSEIYEYLSPKNELLFFIARYDNKDSKDFVPWSWCGNRLTWVRKAWPSPRPLYGLELLSRSPEKPVLIVEGEKACLAARKMCSHIYTVLTWSGGSSAAKQTDWESVYRLQNQTKTATVLWPDNDGAGVKACGIIAKELLQLDPTRPIKFLEIESSRKKGWDAADSGFDWKAFLDWAKNVAKPISSVDEADALISKGEELLKKEQAEAKEKKKKASFHVEQSETPPIDASYEVLPPEPQNPNASAILELRYKKEKSGNEWVELAELLTNSKFMLFQDVDMSRLYEVVDAKTKEVKLITDEGYVLRHISKTARETGAAVTPNQAKTIFNTWKLNSEPLNRLPQDFCWPDDDCWTLKRIPWEPEAGEYPAWEEALCRMSSREDFMAFVWSIFEKMSRSRQFLYLYDSEGQAGKSTIIRVLGKLLGNAYCSISGQFIENDRWLMQHVYNKRLVSYPDCKIPSFCMRENLRAITSGDDSPIEEKGKATITRKIYLKLIVGSNSPPKISGQKADKSRLIRIDIKRNSEKHNDPDWEARLESELSAFLHACRAVYHGETTNGRPKCLNHGNISLEQSTIDAIQESADSYEEDIADLVERRIVVETKDDYVERIDLLQMFREEGIYDSNKIKKIREYIERESPDYVRYYQKSYRVEGEKTSRKHPMRFWGIQLKESPVARVDIVKSGRRYSSKNQELPEISH